VLLRDGRGRWREYVAKGGARVRTSGQVREATLRAEASWQSDVRLSEPMPEGSAWEGAPASEAYHAIMAPTGWEGSCSVGARVGWLACAPAPGRRRYRVLRSPTYERMSRGKMRQRLATGQLYQLPDVGESGDEILLASNVTEVSKRIGQLIGFDADQFCQVVLLPQGQFQRFLLAEVKDRSAIMQRIFRTERYQRLEEALLQESIQLERTANEERAQIDQMLRSENLNTSDELRARIAKLKEAIVRHAEELKALEDRQKDTRHAREAGTAAEQKVQDLAY